MHAPSSLQMPRAKTYQMHVSPHVIHAGSISILLHMEKLPIHRRTFSTFFSN